MDNYVTSKNSLTNCTHDSDTNPPKGRRCVSNQPFTTRRSFMKTTSTASFAMAAAVLALSAASVFAADAPKGSSGKAIAANLIAQFRNAVPINHLSPLFPATNT